MKRYKILVNLDSLMDTLLGTVITVNPDWVEPLIANGYLTRLSNKLSLYNPAIDDAVIAARWASRDMDVLRVSNSTNILNLLINYAAISNAGDPEHPEAIYMSLVVNTYPYQLSQSETVTLFTMLRDIIGITHIRQVIMPITEITPTYLKNNINVLILNNLDEWNDAHIMSLPDCPIPTIQCKAPLIFRKGMEDAEYMEGIEAGIEAAYGSHLRLELLPLSDFSICPPQPPVSLDT